MPDLGRSHFVFGTVAVLRPALPVQMPPPVLSQKPTILAAWFCPFAQRTLITANSKRPALQYTLHEVSYDELYGKPQWFKDLHPQGLIPIIAYKKQPGSPAIAQPTAAADPDTVSIKESLVCNEYLEDAYPQTSLLPSDPAGRAAARLMIQRFSDKAVPAFYRMLVQQDKAVQAEAATVLDGELQWLVDNMHPQGPLAMGQQLSLVDCAIAPFLIRLFVLEHYRNYTSYQQLNGGAVHRRIADYLAAAEQHPAVSATLYHPEQLDYKQQLLQSYARYADGSANSMMARVAKQD